MADPWLNSLATSPLVRTLGTVPSRSTHFVHGIADNVPPFSLHKQRVGYYMGAAGGADATYKFRIPQSGYLNKMYLRVLVEKDVVTGNLGNMSKLDGGTKNYVCGTGVQSSAWNVARFIDSVTLQTHSRVLSRLYGDSIVARCQHLGTEERNVWGQLMRGYASHSANTVGVLSSCVAGRRRIPWMYNTTAVPDDSIVAEPTNGDASVEVSALSKYAVIYVPLPFSCLQAISHNFQTRFVENLELHVMKKNLLQLANVFPTPANAGKIKFDPELICIFHQWSDPIESTIRNTNYQKGKPATILGYDEMEETDIAWSNSGTGDDGAALTTATISMRSNNLVTDIILIHTGIGIARNITASAGYATAAAVDVASTVVGQPNLGRTFGQMVNYNGYKYEAEATPSKIELRGSGNTIWETCPLEAAADHMQYSLQNYIPRDYKTYLEEGQWFGASQALCVAPIGTAGGGTATGTYPSTGTSYSQFVNQRYDWNVAEMEGLLNNLYESGVCTQIRFALDGNETMHTGALSMQGISDPKLILTIPGVHTAATTYLRCIVRYKCLLRIDSDTGIITRTMDT